MTKNKLLQTNNISTIATFIALGITIILTYFGYEINHETLIPVISGIITFIIVIWSSRNPNTLKILGNAPAPLETQETVLNDEYETDGDGA